MAKKCGTENCEMYPWYGVAPHTHDLSGGSFIGSTRSIPKENWPKHFVEDKSEPGLGTYYCPECLKLEEALAQGKEE